MGRRDDGYGRRRTEARLRRRPQRIRVFLALSALAAATAVIAVTGLFVLP